MEQFEVNNANIAKQQNLRQTRQDTADKLSASKLNKVYDECQPKHIAIYFAFKLTPILIYLLLKLLTDQYLSTFIVIILLLSCDFWVTKNITGRKLVALKWYSKIDQNNQEKWFFESASNREPATINKGAFWIGQIIPILFWVIIFLINVITLSIFWVFLAIFCCTLLITNFILYLECKGDHQERVNNLTKKVGVQFFELNQEK